MFVSLLVPVLVIIVVVLLVRRRPGTSAPSAVGAKSVRRFFQYLLLFGLVVVVAIGVSGLLGRALESRPFAQDDLALARNLAFVVVGTPLLAVVAWWSWRQLAADPVERTSAALGLTVLLAGVVSLVTVMTSAHPVLIWLLGESDMSRMPLARVLAWGAVLAAVWWVSRIIDAPVRRAYHLIGSLLGLSTLTFGTVGLLGEAVSRAAFGPDADEYGVAWRAATASVLIGLSVWSLYWWGHARSAERDTRWLAFVMLAGVGGGFVTALVGFSTAVATSAIWLFGEPSTDVAELHFHDVPQQGAAVVVGLAVWWYHRGVMGEARTTVRTGVQRLYEYLMAGIALVAAAAGLVVLVAAVLEAVTASGTAGEHPSVANTLIVATTVLLVALPVWAVFWRRAQRARTADPLAECGSTVRRTYLALLVGVGALAAVVAAITGAYLLFADAVTATVGSSTVRSMRYPVGIVLAAGSVAAGYAVQLRRDRRLLPATHAPVARQILLIGPADPRVAHEVARATGATVQAWWTDDGTPWRLDEVLAAIRSQQSDAVVLADRDGLRVIPVRRPSRDPRSAPAILSG